MYVNFIIASRSFRELKPPNVLRTAKPPAGQDQYDHALQGQICSGVASHLVYSAFCLEDEGLTRRRLHTTLTIRLGFRTVSFVECTVVTFAERIRSTRLIYS
jgi:hypothetical protein